MFKSKRIFTILVCILLLAVNMSTVFAAPPKTLEITVTEFIGNPVWEPFTITGAAVSAGLVCGTGTVEDLVITQVDPGGSFYLLDVEKRFHCGNGSGTFDVYMKVKLDKITGNTTANWKITGGTVDYENLKGNGKLVGTAQVSFNIIDDVYYGKVH